MMTKIKIKNIILLVALIILALFFIMPVYFTIINSFKPLREIVTSYTSFPKTFRDCYILH